MSRFRTLLKREWLEHRTSFLWFQLAALAAFVLVSVLVLTISDGAQVEIQMQSEGMNASNGFFISQWSDEDWQERAALFRSTTAAPFYLIYVVAALFMLLGSLYDERKDRTVLFWKSLPVTDLETVLSKLVLALWIAPLVVVASTLLAQLFGLIILSVFVWSRELGDAWQLWSHSGLALGGFQLLLGFFVQSLWVLPLASYLLLVSVSVPRMTLLWAVALPVLPVLLESVLLETRVLATGISKHMEPAALPVLTGDDERIMPVVSTVGDQLALLVNPDLWIGVLIGAALLYAAARVRGINNEL
jgi:ABC-2 type transport system permease protein